MRAEHMEQQAVAADQLAGHLAREAADKSIQLHNSRVSEVKSTMETASLLLTRQARAQTPNHKPQTFSSCPQEAHKAQLKSMEAR